MVAPDQTVVPPQQRRRRPATAAEAVVRCVDARRACRRRRSSRRLPTAATSIRLDQGATDGAAAKRDKEPRMGATRTQWPTAEAVGHRRRPSRPPPSPARDLCTTYPPAGSGTRRGGTSPAKSVRCRTQRRLGRCFLTASPHSHIPCRRCQCLYFLYGSRGPAAASRHHAGRGWSQGRGAGAWRHRALPTRRRHSPNRSDPTSRVHRDPFH